MTDFNDPHAPAPDFKASLKRELLRAHRAQRHFPQPRSSRGRHMLVVTAITCGAALTLSIGLVLGASTGFASAEELDARKRETELATMATARQLAALRLELAQTYYTEVQREVAAGTATPAELRIATEEVDSMQAYVGRVDIDIASRRITAPPPRPRFAIIRELPMRRVLTALACAAVAATPLPAQTAAGQQGVPVIEVSAPTAQSSATIGTILGVRELPGGRLLVNDAGRKQVVIFGPNLGAPAVALDSTPGSAQSYPGNAAKIVRWQGDSTLFGGTGSRSTVVLDASGRVSRALSVPPMEVVNGTALPFQAPDAIDPKGRLYAKGPTRVMAGANGVAKAADSVQLLRADLDTRTVDTVGAIRASGLGNRSDPAINGRRVVTTIIQPVPTEDSWTVLSDGTLAIVRGQDYHVDWVFPDGTKGATGKLPFDWKRLTDTDKQRMVDSARVVWDSLMLIRNRRVGAVDARGNVVPVSGDVGGGGAGGGATGRQGGAGPPPNNDAGFQRMDFVPLSEIPDFYPPVHATAAMPDLDGNLWILPTTSAQSQHGELVYDVVSPKRGLFQRVRVPVGRSIVGFGKGGVVYLQSGDRANGFHLERVKLDVK